MPTSTSRALYRALHPVSLVLCLAATDARALAMLKRTDAPPATLNRAVVQIHPGCAGSPTAFMADTFPVRVAAPAAAQATTAAVKAGELSVATPWMRATPGGAKVGAGYLTIRNGGTQRDRLVGAVIPQAERAEIHSMSVEGGVMKMAPVEGGLAIEPGQTVVLKPGGYHLMFRNLATPLKAGERVKGSLSFERAGTVEVEFRVEPIGAAGAGHHHH